MKIKLDPGAIKPDRAHSTDAGLDLFMPFEIANSGEKREIHKHVPAFGSVIIDTGVHMELPPGTYGKIESKSGLNVKHDIVSCGGVIDEGYTGSIVVKLYCMSDKGYVFKSGDKVAQLIVQPYLAPPMVIVDELEDTERGSGGFGSTGR